VASVRRQTTLSPPVFVASNRRGVKWTARGERRPRKRRTRKRRAQLAQDRRSGAGWVLGRIRVADAASRSPACRCRLGGHVACLSGASWLSHRRSLQNPRPSWAFSQCFALLIGALYRPRSLIPKEVGTSFRIAQRARDGDLDVRPSHALSRLASCPLSVSSRAGALPRTRSAASGLRPAKRSGPRGNRTGTWATSSSSDSVEWLATYTTSTDDDVVEDVAQNPSKKRETDPESGNGSRSDDDEEGE